ncbi:MAG: alpha/beta fold hydrolase, partial [Acidimicrobiales bacterium]
MAVLVAAMVLVAACTGDDASEGSAPTSEREDPTSTTAAQDVSEIEPDEVRWGVCPFHVPPGAEIDCGMFDVPADHDEPDGETVTLPVAVVRSAHESPAEDPIVYLSGGPGQSTLEPVPMTFGFLYEPLAESRDVILVDQRGTGFARPSLACDEYDGWVEESLGSGLDADELAEQGVARLEECHERLLDQGVDLSDYDSAASAADLELLRRSLGHDEWNLYGISYGTRLAQTILRDHPEGVRSVVLDSAYPLTADLYEEAPANAARAVDELFELCEADPACAERYPDLETRFAALVDELDERPVPVEIVDPSTGERVEEVLDGAGLVGFVFQALYATELAAHLPELIDGVAAGETGTVGVLLGALIQQADLVSVGMQLAVQCREEVAFGDRGSVESAAADQPFVGRFFEGAATLGPGVFEVCEIWDVGAAPAVENEAVSSSVPTLVLAGSLDPITPPAWGRTVADQLESA